MITPEEIKKKAQRIYLKQFLAACLNDESIFPLDIRSNKGKTTGDYNKNMAGLKRLKTAEKSTRGFGYTMQFKQKNTRKYGSQSVLDKIFFETEDDFLHFIGKKKDVMQFEKDAALIRNEIPKLSDWLDEKAKSVIENAEKWDDLLKVCRYFMTHPKPGLYIRELPIEVHTKFIEENTGILKDLLDFLLPSIQVDKDENVFEKRYGLKFKEDCIRFRILDKAMTPDIPDFITDISLPLSEFSNLNPVCQRIFIVENKMTFLTFPKVLESIVIFGGGYKAVKLQEAGWLKKKEIWYWGDMDIRGFDILSKLRSQLPNTRSLMMDMETFLSFERFAVSAKEDRIEVIQNLTDEESAVFQMLMNQPDKNRLEQERISQKFTKERLKKDGLVISS